MDLRVDINAACSIIEKENLLWTSYTEYTPLHLASTENIRSLFPKINTSFEKSLVVTCGGDQPLECLKYGGKNIHTFDINHLAKYGLFLKIGAIRALSYEGFCKFYQDFDLSLYSQIRRFLCPEICIFFDFLFKRYNHMTVIYFMFDKINNYQISNNSSVFIKEGFYQIKDQLNKSDISYIQSDLTDIASKKKQEEYDFIYLSNIFYYNGMSWPQYAEFLNEQLLPHLKQDGAILIHYLYSGLLEPTILSLNSRIGSQIAESKRREFTSLMSTTTGLDTELISVPASDFGFGDGNEDIGVVLKRKNHRITI